LEENPPVETNFGKARIGLADAKRMLISVCGEDGRKAGLALDSHLLLAKLYYACGEFDESLEHFKLSDIDSLKQEITLSSRTLRILAESYAAKGLCIEAKNPKGTSKFKTAEMETEMVSQTHYSIVFIEGYKALNCRLIVLNERPTLVYYICKVKKVQQIWVQFWKQLFNALQ